MVDHFYQTIDGWCDYEDIYREAITRAEDGAVFVEIGAFKGKSGAFAGVEILNSGKKIMLNLVDHFKGNTEHLDVKSTWYESELAQNPEYLFELCTKNLEPVKEVEIAVNSRFPIGVHKRGASWLFYKEGDFK
jgi:hypothetical protein